VTKKPILQLVLEVSEYFNKEELTSREVLTVLRELESNATIGLIFEEVQSEIKDDQE
jgi:hypothetical protein